MADLRTADVIDRRNNVDQIRDSLINIDRQLNSTADDNDMHSSPSSIFVHSLASPSALSTVLDTPKSSVASSVFVLSAATLGAGILSLPYAFSLLGWASASLLLLAVGFVSSYAIRLLLDCAELVGATSYESLGERVFPANGGVLGRRLVAGTSLLLLFGSLTAFFVIIGDTLPPAIQSFSSSCSGEVCWYFRREFLLVFCAALVVLPLCLLRSIHALERWSFLAVGIILAFSFLVVIDCFVFLRRHRSSSSTNTNTSTSADADASADAGVGVHPFEWSVEIFEALPIICLAFTCQIMIFPIWNALALDAKTVTGRSEGDMASDSDADTSVDHIAAAGAEDIAVDTILASASSSSVRASASAQSLTSSAIAPGLTMQRVANWALLLCGSLYLPVGICGFVSFGSFTKGDVLNNYPDDQVLYNVVRLAFTLAICIHYPIVHFSFRGTILDELYPSSSASAAGPSSPSALAHFLFPLVSVSSTVGLAVLVPSLSKIFSFTGAACAVPYCFMYPAAFYIKLHRDAAAAREGSEKQGVDENQKVERRKRRSAREKDEEAGSGTNSRRGESTDVSDEHVSTPLVDRDNVVDVSIIVPSDHVDPPSTLSVRPSSLSFSSSSSVYHPLHSDDASASSNGSILTSPSQSPPSPLIASLPQPIAIAPLSPRDMYQAYALLIVSTIVWFMSVAVSLKDLVQ